MVLQASLTPWHWIEYLLYTITCRICHNIYQLQPQSMLDRSFNSHTFKRNRCICHVFSVVEAVNLTYKLGNALLALSFEYLLQYVIYFKPYEAMLMWSSLFWDERVSKPEPNAIKLCKLTRPEHGKIHSGRVSYRIRVARTLLIFQRRSLAIWSVHCLQVNNCPSFEFSLFLYF